MIVPNIESTINGVECYFSNKNITAYHMVWSEDGHIDVVLFGSVEIGTRKSLFTATETSEIKTKANEEGLFLDDQTQIEESLKSIFVL
jgi:hypothetical protein